MKKTSKKTELKKTTLKTMKNPVADWRGELAELFSVPRHMLEPISSSKDWKR